MDLNKALSYLKTKKFWKEFIIMTAAMFIGAAAVYYFLVPSKLIIGSVSGLSIVLSAILENIGVTISVSTMVIIVNAILLILAYFLIGAEFGIKTVYTALILGPLMDFWDKVLPYTKLLVEGQTSVMGDIWFDLMCFVLMVSICQTLLFSINASSGGLDILGKIFNKYLHFDIGASVAVGGIMICCTAFAINPFRMVVIGIIGTWMDGLCIDYFTASLNKKKRICIISDEAEKIRDYIINDLCRGCSLYEVTGGYTGKKRTEIQSLLTQQEFASLMGFIRNNEIKIFLTAGNVSEIYGAWRPKNYRKTHQLDA